MRFPGIVAIVGMCGLPMQAQECLSGADLAAGIAVSTQDGRVYAVRQAAGGDVAVSMARQAGRDGLFSQMTFAKGVYMTRDVATEVSDSPDSADGEVVVGGNDGGVIDERHAYPRNAPVPVAGKSWRGTVKYTRDQDGPSIGPQPQITARLLADYQFLAEKSVTISGCAYRVIPVELTLQVTAQSRARAEGAPVGWFEDSIDRSYLTRRLIYFPDIGFSVITRESSDMDAGGMEQNGITGLVRAGG